MKSQILGFCVALVASLFVSVRGQCNVQCAAGQTVDCRTCACVNNIDCTNRTIVDSIECATLDCDSITTPLCPKKCLCQRPSVMTNYCSPCLNNGLLDKSTCKCTCPIGYQGPQCQYTASPCSVTDSPKCSTVNCYNATELDFFTCQRKCLCCQNKQCLNLGTLNSDCTCKCVTELYDPTQNCTLIPGKCGNHPSCYTQFKLPDQCNDPTVKVYCPLACGVCS